MKKKIAGCILFAMLMTLTTGFFATGESTTLISEGFDQLSGGKLPGAFTKLEKQLVEVVADPKNASNKVVHVQKTSLEEVNPNDCAQFSITIPSQKSKFVIESDLYIVGGDIWVVATEGTAFPYGPGVSTGSNMSPFDGTAQKSLGVAFPKEVWNKMAIEVDPATATYNIILNGKLITSSALKFRNPALSSCNTVIFRTASGKTQGEFYADNIKISSGAFDYSKTEVVQSKAEVAFSKPADYAVKNNAVMKEFYLSPTGSDSGDGSLDAPFLTVQKAKDAVRAISSKMTGDIVVNFLPGEYLMDKTVEFSENDSGTNGFQVIYRAKEGPLSVRLYGAKALSGWTKDRDNIWKVKVDKAFYTLYENDTRAIKARFPNKEFNPKFPSSKAPYLTTVDTDKENYQSIKLKPEDMEKISFSNIEDANIVIWPWNKADWQMWVSPIQSVDKSNSVIVPKFSTGVPGGKIGVNIPFGFDARCYIEGMYELLDAPGEFHLDSKTSTLYYWPINGDPNTQTKVYAPSLQTIFKLAGSTQGNLVENIVFDGLSFEKTDFLRGMRGWFEADTEYARIGTIDMTNTQNIKIVNSRIKNAGITGIFMHPRSGQNYIANTVIENIGNSGIILLGNPGEAMAYNKIENVLIHDVGENSVDCAGINIFFGRHNIITNVEVYNSPRYGISVRGGAGSFLWFNRPADLDNEKYGGRSKDNIIKNSKFYKTNQDSGDTGALHLAGVSFETEPYATNYFENIYIDDIYAHPSMQDVKPNGIFCDYQTFGQSFKNIKVGNENGHVDANKPDSKYKYFTSYSQLRYNESGMGTYDNCSWYPGFDESKMDYSNMGITERFPTALLPETQKMQGTVILQEGSPHALVGGQAKEIDAENPAVLPVNISDRVLVPLRFIAESFGANVSFDESTETALIVYKDSKISLTKNSKQMLVGDKTITLDVPATAFNDRIFIPIRAVSEALGKEVFYDSGLIVLSDQKALYSSEKDRIIIDRIGEKLLMNYMPGKLKYTAVTASKMREYTSNYQITKASEGVMFRNGGALNSAFVAVTYVPGIGARLITRMDHYSIPTYTDLGIMQLPIKVGFVVSGGKLKVTVNDNEVLSIPNTWEKPLIGSYAMDERTEKPVIAYGELVLPTGNVKSIKVEVPSTTIETGKTVRLVTNAISTEDKKFDISEENPVYTSSNEAVISVSGNIITAKGLGEVVITTSLRLEGKDFKDSISVKVVEFNEVLIDETFDPASFNSSAWVFKTDGADGSYVKVSDEGKLEIYAGTSTSPHQALRTFDNFNGLITMEFDFKAEFSGEKEKTGAMLAYILGDTGSFCISTFAYPGKFTYFLDGKMVEFGVCESGKEYKVKLVANVPNNTFDVYIDGTKLVDSARFRNPSTALAGIQVGGSSDAAKTKLWWDNIKVSKKKA